MKTLYLSDLDGTLLTPDQRLSEYTADVINRFVRAGGLFSYATARSFVTASKAVTGFQAAFPVITYNGAFIVDGATGRHLLSTFFTPEEARYIREQLTARGVVPIVYSFLGGKERFSYIEKTVTKEMRFFLDSRVDDFRRQEADDLEALYGGDTFYFACMDSEAALSPVYTLFKTDSRYHCIYQRDLYSGAQWCELLPARATKAAAALELKRMLGCDNLVCFGDGRNDLKLFAASDERYAMANAVPELKAAATAVIGSNAEDGVARWIEEYAFRSL